MTNLAGATHHVLLLSRSDDRDTLVLGAAVRNTKRASGRPLAWAVASRIVRYSSLAQQPATTDDLDRLEAGQNETTGEAGQSA